MTNKESIIYLHSLLKMEKAAYFILILCGILSQGICQLNEENNEKSSDLQIRQKRVAGGHPHGTDDSPYLVNVLLSGNDHCPGTLLTDDVIISSAECFVHQNLRLMKILSRSRITGSIVHPLIRVIFLDPNYNGTHQTVKNLVLVRFAPPINFNTSPNRPIPIYSGFLAREHLLTHVITWERPFHAGGRIIPSIFLRSLSVNVISIEYCSQVYNNIVGAGNICTVGMLGGEHCENKDTGAPLVIGNHLLGIFVYHGELRASNPDVFMNLLDYDIKRWIHEYVPTLRLF